MKNNFSLYLASQSPRRSELLSQIGISFQVLAVDVDETVNENENAQDYVIRLAEEKARAGWLSERLEPHLPVLGSDTAVVVDGQILGKPADQADAVRMLKLLSGKTHQVMTAVALAQKSENSTLPELSTVLSVSDVTFKKLSEMEIAHYWASGETLDKAGAYGIQGQAAAFICHLSGSYSGVMGLPLYETVQLLQKAGISTDSLVVS